VLLIARPNDISLEGKMKDKWFGPLIEASLHFRLDVYDKIEVIPWDTLAKSMHRYTDLQSSLTQDAYAKIAQNRRCTYILFQDYEAIEGKEIQYLAELHGFPGNKTLMSIERAFAPSEIAGMLDTCITQICKAMKISPPDRSSRFMKTGIMGREWRNFTQLGAIIRDQRYTPSPDASTLAARCNYLSSADPSNMLAGYFGALLFRKTNRHDEAGVMFGKLLPDIGPEYPILYAFAADEFRQAKRYSDALSAIAGGEKNGAPARDLVIQKALIYEAQGQKSQARAVYEQVLMRDPNQPDALAFLAEQSNVNKAFGQALAYADRVLQRQPGNGRAHLEKGKSCMALDRNEEAIGHLSTAVVLLPGNPLPSELLGDLYSRKNSWAKAADNYVAALKGKQGDYDLCMKAAKAFKKANNPNAALDVLRRSEASVSQNPMFYKEKGMLEFQLKDSTRAMADLELYMQSLGKGQDLEVAAYLGILYAARGKADQAIPLLIQALPAAPDKNALRMALARIYFDKKQPKNAVVYLDQVTASDPSFPGVNKLLGDSYLTMGNKARAATAYVAHRKSQGNSVELQSTIARLYFETGNTEKAVDEYVALLAMDKRNAEANFRLAHLYLMLNNIAQAELCLKRGLDLGKGTPELFFEFGEKYRQIAQTQKAIDAFANCIKVQPDNVTALQRLVELYGKANRDSIAAETCMRLSVVDTLHVKEYLEQAAAGFERGKAFDRVKITYRIYFDKKFTNSDMTVRLAALEFKSRNYIAVIPLLEKLPDARASSEEVLRMLAVSGTSLGNYEVAVRALEKLIVKLPGDLDLAETAALANEKAGNIARATTLYEQYLSLPGTRAKDADYAYHVGELYEKRSMRSAAQARYQKNTLAYSRDPRNWERLGTMYMEDKNPGEAYAVLQRAVSEGIATPAIKKMLAQTLLIRGEKNAALKYFQLYLKNVPSDSTALLESGLIYFSQKNYARTIEELSQASALLPQHYTCNFALGKAYLLSGLPEKAIWPLERASSIDEKDTVSLGLLLQCYRQTKNEDKQIAVLQKLNALRPTDVAIARDLGLMYTKRQRITDALPLLEAVNRARPTDVEVNLLLADLYKSQNNEVLRLQHLESAQRSAPQRFEVNMSLGTYYAERKLYDKAADLFAAAVAANPKSAPARYQYALVLQARNADNAALAQFQAAASIDGKNINYLAPVVELSYRAGQKKAALAAARKALQLPDGKGNAHLLYWAGRTYMDLDFADSAKACLTRAADIDKSCIPCGETLGDISMTSGDYQQAENSYTRALDADGRNLNISLKLGTVYVAAGKNDKAESLYERILGENPANDEARFWLCRIYFLTNRPDIAGQVFEKRPQVATTGWYFLLTGSFHERAGKVQEALLAYSSASRMLPDNAEAQAGCGRALLGAGSYDNALLYLGKAMGLDPKNCKIMVDMGRAYEALKEFTEAMALYQEALKCDRNDEDVVYYTARLQSKKSHQTAIETIRKGLKANPKSAKLYLALGHEFRVTGQFEDALDSYKKAEKLQGEDGLEATRYIGDIYFASLKNPGKAKEYYQRYVESGGKDRTPAQRLKQL
jgi:tetratricopeptide (TPR) repeat protein